MKTEKEFSEIFVASCNCDQGQRDFLAELSTHYWIDLTSHLNRFFSNDDRVQITEKAAKELALQLGMHASQDAWKNVIRSFLKQDNWGFSTIDKKPQPKETEEQKIFWKFFKYVSVLFAGMVLLKFVILFLGMQAAENPNQVSSQWVYVICVLAAGLLALFVYRNRNDNG